MVISSRCISAITPASALPDRGRRPSRRCAARSGRSAEVRVLELRDEHRRHAVERGAAFAIHRLQHAPGIERFDRADARAVREGAEDAHHAAEAMKQRHAQAQTVRRRVSSVSASACALLRMLRLDSMTPLGKPVVPDVYCMLMTSSTPIRSRARRAPVPDAGGARAELGVRREPCWRLLPDEDETPERRDRAGRRGRRPAQAVPRPSRDVDRGQFVDVIDLPKTADGDERGASLWRSR